MIGRTVAGLLTGVLFASAACNSTPSAGKVADPPLRTLSEQEVIDLMVGSGIQATRAANVQRNIERVRELLAEGRRFQTIALEDLPDDWTLLAAAGGIGGGGAWEHVRQRMEKAGTPTLARGEGTIRAVEALSQHIGKPFDAVIRNEAGDVTLGSFQTAFSLGVPVVDACPAGRAKPEVQQSVAFINGLRAAPAALVSRWGDIMIVAEAIDDYRYEDIARAAAVASGGGVSQARNVMSGAEAKRGLIPGNLSQAIEFGRVVREAAARGDDPIAALVQVAGGYELFRGIVSKADFTGERGHSYWDVELDGAGRYAGHTYKVWVKNENIVAWLDGMLDIASPDYIYNLDPANGWPISGVSLGGYPIGKEVAMVGVPAPAAWRTPNGVELIGPRHFGFDFDYVPIEELQKRRPDLTTD